MSKKLKVALIGNPNTGKSSLFNALTGLKQKVGNFPGITVEKSTGFITLSDGTQLEIIDLPGTYSLFPKSADETIPFQLLLEKENPQHPDVVLFIADASNLKRNLVLLTQVIDLGFPVILTLNMIDQAEAKGIKINTDCLSKMLGGIPVIPVNARRQKGIDKLLDAFVQGGGISGKSFIHEDRIGKLPVEELKSALKTDNYYFILLNLQYALANVPLRREHKAAMELFRIANNFDSGVYQREDLLYRYKVIGQILGQCVTEAETSRFKKVQTALDAVLTHRVWGYLIFFFILFVIFQAIFSWAEYPMMLIENGFSWLSNLISNTLPQGILNDMISNGILPGLSGVLVFIPQIVFLFMFITIMEDTGYLARVAFLMDRIMRKFGLNGKSVVPLISGTACAVPAIMSARNIENKVSRLITILVTPLMSCSARLPVYILLIGLVIPDRNIYGILNIQGLTLMGLYLLGFLAAIGAAFVFNLIMKSNVKQYFILELPVYRIPSARTVGITVYKRVNSFVTEAGKIIIAISIILWFLASFGPPGVFDKVESRYKTMEESGLYDATAMEKSKNGELLEKSFAGRLGKIIEPVISPLGFDWKIGIALVTSFAAREVFVGTMSTLYGLEGDEADFSKLKANMLSEKDPATGQPVYTFATVISLLIFYVFAMQCMSTLAVTYKETLSAKWTLVQLLYMSGLAYIFSLVVYNLLR